LEWGLQTGFSGLSIDLMYALPGQELMHLNNTLAQLRDYPLSHLSAYELIWEEGTPFYEQWKRGQRAPSEEDLVLRMADRIENFCEARGLKAYEVSNYARVGHESRHNLQYWDYESFVGLGAGAVSFLRINELSSAAREKFGIGQDGNIYGVRLTRPRPLGDYSARGGSLSGFEVELISIPTAMQEFMMMGLRKTDGIQYAEFGKKFNDPLPPGFLKTIDRATHRGWMISDGSGCRLTKTGILMSNEVLGEFIN
jgi:Coproporphyrinogen III oxidase and related Fe-S oxidoreductases